MNCVVSFVCDELRVDTADFSAIGHSVGVTESGKSQGCIQDYWFKNRGSFPPSSSSIPRRAAALPSKGGDLNPIRAPSEAQPQRNLELEKVILAI